MKLSLGRCLIALTALVAAVVSACSDAEPTAVPGPVDAGVDRASPVTPPPPSPGDAGARCAFPLRQAEPCGKCGTHTRECLKDGTWGPWGSCANERKGDDLCTVGARRESACGNCGTVVDTCDPVTCTWAVGTCQGEGCKPGTSETEAGGCTSGQVKSRSCDFACTWSAASACGLPRGWRELPDAPIAGRVGHVAVWTGSKMLVWGGRSRRHATVTSQLLFDGAELDPVTNTWTSLPPLPAALVPQFPLSRGDYEVQGVYTSIGMFVWGTAIPGGLIYRPGTGWERAPTATIAGEVVEATYTAGDVVAYAKERGSVIVLRADGVGFELDLAGLTWRTIPQAPILPRYHAAGAWTGKELVVWGGLEVRGTTQSFAVRSGARFDPATGAWTTIAEPPVAPGGYLPVFVPSEPGHVITWGGLGGRVGRHNDRFTPMAASSLGGARYRVGGGWASLAPLPPQVQEAAPPASWGQAAFFAGGKLWLWSGGNGFGDPVAGGLVYDVALDRWTPFPNTKAVSPRTLASAVWTGEEAIVWGGTGNDANQSGLKSGGAFRP